MNEQLHRHSLQHSLTLTTDLCCVYASDGNVGDESSSEVGSEHFHSQLHCRGLHSYSLHTSHNIRPEYTGYSNQYSCCYVIIHANGSRMSIAIIASVSVWVCLFVSPHDNSKMNDPKVFKLGIGNDLSWDSQQNDNMILESKGHDVQKHIEGD